MKFKFYALQMKLEIRFFLNYYTFCLPFCYIFTILKYVTVVLLFFVFPIVLVLTIVSSLHGMLPQSFQKLDC